MGILTQDTHNQMYLELQNSVFRTLLQGRIEEPFLTLRVRRDHIVRDSFTQLSQKRAYLKKRLRIEFVEEEGVDAGGITKEWFLLLTRELFQDQKGLFIEMEDSKMWWFNPAVSVLGDVSFDEDFELVGILFGLAVFHGILLDIHFPMLLYRKLLNVPTDLYDLQELDPAFYRSVQYLKEYSEPDFQEHFSLTFVGNIQAFGESMEVPLIPNGENIPVTFENKQSYIDSIVRWKMHTSIEKPFAAFRHGFMSVCGGNALSLFRPEEIERLIVGDSAIDFNTLKYATEYEGYTFSIILPTVSYQDRFTAGEPYIEQFWEIVKSFPTDLQKKFMSFVTGSDRIPSTGIETMTFKVSDLKAVRESL